MTSFKRIAYCERETFPSVEQEIAYLERLTGILRMIQAECMAQIDGECFAIAYFSGRIATKIEASLGFY